ncbi:MAG: hypothetical protein HKN76_14470, partial [Saprospiraceae bacterium]|nr:hypothetical protein [Saprospiraceae bacterium]
SYGMVIGYCRGDHFPNVLYGYVMLAVIGGLYGCIGGGFLGLGLETTESKQPKWAQLLTEMVAGGMLAWGLLIYQLEWFMTPPRSELWAACLGAAIAMIWYMVRNKFDRALRVAIYSMLGAGFGFSFGNFIQGLGQASGLSYNWWNVMEFILGLSGGIAMAYAVATTKWEKTMQPSRTVQNLSIIFIFLILPLVNYFSGFTEEKIRDLAENLSVSDIDSFVLFQHIEAWLSITLFAAIGIAAWWQRASDRLQKWFSFVMLSSLSLCYTLLALIHKGFFHIELSIKNSITLYLPILFLAVWLGTSITQPWLNSSNSAGNKKIWQLVAGMTICIILIALISIYINNPTDRTPQRF